MDMVSSEDGTVVHSWEIGEPGYTNINPVGWTDTGVFFYNVYTTTVKNNFSYLPATSHAFYMDSGRIEKYSESLGTLQAIIR